jgi:hypothetical protein
MLRPVRNGGHNTNIVMRWSALSCRCFVVCSQSTLVPSYLQHGTQRGVQSMDLLIPRDLNIEQREIHWKPLPQNGIMSPEILREWRAWRCGEETR